MRNTIIIYAFLIIVIINIIGKCITIEVETKLGKIIGQKQTIDGKELNVFLGIPYAQPPLKDLRFKLPVPIKAWKEPIKALKWPNVCYQLKLSPLFINQNMSEDCLYINVFSPNVNADSRLPVILLMHGGGYARGTSGRIANIPDLLAARGNVITVNFNYRLSTFGFLYAANKDAPGNVGIHDQVTALHWVRNHIESFGGDPNRITIFTGSPASIHLLSPLSRNLYQNSIVTSGSALTHIYGSDPAVAYRAWLRGAKIIGCGNGRRFTPATIDCLRNLEPEKLTLIPENKEIPEFDKFFGVIPMVIYGDNILPYKPLQMLKRGDYRKGITVLEGDTNDEGSGFAVFFDPIKFNSSNTLTIDEAKDEMKLIVNSLTSNVRINADEVTKVYFKGISATDANGFRRAMGTAIGDYYITCRVIRFFQLFQHRQNNIYQYYFTQKPSDLSTSVVPCPEWAGTCHNSDQILWFGNPFLYPNNFTDNDRRVSDNAMSIVTQFAYNGVPPEQNGIKWQKHSNNKPNEPYYEIAINGKFGTGIKNEECNVLWQKYIDGQ